MEIKRKGELESLADELILELGSVAPFVHEGTVMTMGPAPYRRIDCDRRALAYVRARPRKGMVRVDLSGLWVVPRESRLLERSSGACACLVLKTREDKREAISFLLAAVEMTRSAQARQRARDEERRRRKVELRAMFGARAVAIAAEPGE
jgi:hypothetical protein